MLDVRLMQATKWLNDESGVAGIYHWCDCSVLLLPLCLRRESEWSKKENTTFHISAGKAHKLFVAQSQMFEIEAKVVFHCQKLVSTLLKGRIEIE